MMWMRLLNPDAVDVEVLHAGEGRHLLRVSRPVSGRVNLADEVELVPTRLGDDEATTSITGGAGVLFVHADSAPSVGNWRGASDDEVLRAISEDAG